MTRRLLINLALAYILFSLIILIKDYILIEVLHDNSFYSGSFLQYIKGNVSMRLITPTVFAVLVLLPYNIIILRAGKLSLFAKILIFESILILMFCLAGTFTNVWLEPYWINLKFILYFIPISIVFASIIHITIDKKQRPMGS